MSSPSAEARRRGAIMRSMIPCPVTCRASLFRTVSLSATENVVPRKAVQPRPELGLSREGVQLAPHANEYLLCQIFGGLFVDHAHAKCVDSSDVVAVKPLESSMVSSRCPLHISCLEKRRHSFAQSSS